jgi:hypothetical protein
VRRRSIWLQENVSLGAIVYKLMKMKRPVEEIVTKHGSTVLRLCRAVLARIDAWPRCAPIPT